MVVVQSVPVLVPRVSPPHAPDDSRCLAPPSGSIPERVSACLGECCRVSLYRLVLEFWDGEKECEHLLCSASLCRVAVLLCWLCFCVVRLCQLGLVGLGCVGVPMTCWLGLRFGVDIGLFRANNILRCFESP